jgi:hypothetical protein
MGERLMLIDCSDYDDDDYDDDPLDALDEDILDIIEYEIDGYNGPYCATLIICPHCHTLTANVWPLPLPVLQCDSCTEWLPVYALGWMVDGLRGDA